MHICSISCDWHLSHMMQGYQHVVKKVQPVNIAIVIKQSLYQLLQQSKDLPEFIMEFKSLLVRFTVKHCVALYWLFRAELQTVIMHLSGLHHHHIISS